MVSLVLRTEASYLVKGPPQGQWTLTDWESLPDDGNLYEIINGILYMTSSPSFFHQYISFNLTRLVGVPAFEQKLAQAAYAPIGVIMPNCDPVQPDFVLVKWERAGIIHDRRIYGVPDLIIEILSPGNRDYDEQVKLLAYANAGVPEYGIVDPAARQLRLHRWVAFDGYSEPQIFQSDDMVELACVPGLKFRVGDLFEGAADTSL